MKAILGVMSIVVLLAFGACSDSNGKPSYLFKSAPKEGLAAKVGEVEITNAELQDGIESELFEAETKVFDI